MKKRILCFGDSNTRGYVPGSLGNSKFDENTRWTSLLQKYLGAQYEVIEEGLDGRRTIWEDPRPGWEGRNGKIYLVPCLQSHKPIDLIILMIGTTDLKDMFNLTAETIANGTKELLDIIGTLGCGKENNAPQILLVAPSIVDESTEFASRLFKGGTNKNIELNNLYKKLAQDINCEFLNAADYVHVDKNEGVHLDAENHKKLARVMFDKVSSMNI